MTKYSNNKIKNRGRKDGSNDVKEGRKEKEIGILINEKEEKSQQDKGKEKEDRRICQTMRIM